MNAPAAQSESAQAAPTAVKGHAPCAGLPDPRSKNMLADNDIKTNNNSRAPATMQPRSSSRQPVGNYLATSGDSCWPLTGEIDAIAVESTGCYAASLVRYLREHDIRVVEVNQAHAHTRRRVGKSDPIDAGHGHLARATAEQDPANHRAVASHRGGCSESSVATRLTAFPATNSCPSHLSWRAHAPELWLTHLVSDRRRPYAAAYLGWSVSAFGAPAARMALIRRGCSIADPAAAMPTTPDIQEEELRNHHCYACR